jgi:hypothetical protein
MTLLKINLTRQFLNHMSWMLHFFLCIVTNRVNQGDLGKWHAHSGMIGALVSGYMCVCVHAHVQLLTWHGSICQGVKTSQFLSCMCVCGFGCACVWVNMRLCMGLGEGEGGKIQNLCTSVVFWYSCNNQWNGFPVINPSTLDRKTPPSCWSSKPRSDKTGYHVRYKQLLFCEGRKCFYQTYSLLEHAILMHS